MAEQVETVQTPEKSKIHAEEDCRLAARGLLQHRIERGMERYVVEHTDELRGITSSQLGVIASMCISCQYKPEKAEWKLEVFWFIPKKRQNATKSRITRKNRIPTIVIWRKCLILICLNCLK